MPIINYIHFLEYNYQNFYVQPRPLQFLREPDDHFTLSTANVTFVCSVIMYNGLSEITWYFNNSIIKAGPHYNIHSRGQGRSTLTIRNISAKDQGDYHCRVSDWKAKIRSRSGHLHGKQ